MGNGLELLSRAEAFARVAHANQVRGNRAKEPYVNHLREVAELVSTSRGSLEEIIAAWLHDSVEDTETTLEQIHEQFGPSVSEIVLGLTDKPEWEGLPLLERKTLQAERVAGETASIKRVKLADQISNTRCCILDPPTNWSAEKVRDYVEGARRIAIACMGISTYLDTHFEVAYREAYEKRIRLPFVYMYI